VKSFSQICQFELVCSIAGAKTKCRPLSTQDCKLGEEVNKENQIQSSLKILFSFGQSVERDF